MAKVSKLTKFVKRNKVVTVLVVVFLLAVILVPSLYFGLKSSKQDSTIKFRKPPKQTKYFADYIRIEPDKGKSISTIGYSVDNIYIRLKGLVVNNLQDAIDSGKIQQKIFELVKFKSSIYETTFSELINTNSRKLIVKNITTNNIEVEDAHDAYLYKDMTDKDRFYYIDIEIVILYNNGAPYYIYNVYKFPPQWDAQILLFKSSHKLVNWFPVESIIFNKFPKFTGENEIEAPSLDVDIRSNIHDFPRSIYG